MKAVALYYSCAAARFGVPHFQGGIPLSAPSHNCLAIWGELTTPHRARVAIKDLQL